MKLFEQLTEQLFTLQSLLEQIEDGQFTYPCTLLSGATIGGHTRHIIELLQCAINGYDKGMIDYINRERNLSLEQNKKAASAEVQKLLHSFHYNNKQLLVLAEDGNHIPSTYYRELLYNLDHTIHHLALIKVSLLDQNIVIENKNLGMAYSTLLYNNKMEKA